MRHISGLVEKRDCDLFVFVCVCVCLFVCLFWGEEGVLWLGCTARADVQSYS